jgi:hypothetical protein
MTVASGSKLPLAVTACPQPDFELLQRGGYDDGDRQSVVLSELSGG